MVNEIVNIEPFVKKIKTKLKAVDIYSLFRDYNEAVFLDSGRDEESIGRFSFIGLFPFLKFKSKGNICELNDKNFPGNTFEELNKIFNKYKMKNNTELPFIGGGIGFLSYDLGRTVETITEIAIEDVNIPDCYYNFYDCFIIVDNLQDEVWISSLGILKPKEEILKQVEALINLSSTDGGLSKSKQSSTLEKFPCEVAQYSTAKDALIDGIFKSNFEKDEYIKTVSKVKNYIRSGDIYITNLTQRFKCSFNKDAYETYKNLRKINPAPFAAFMPFKDLTIISSSPERFLKIVNGEVETRPIKGTRPRGKTDVEDLKNKNELLSSEKDKAELLMIVDLERNDLSRVCKPSTVKVTELFKLEAYSTVFHLVSTVIGELKECATSIDCIKACFPGGSITGAPKIRSMEIIDELEKVRRGLYTGSIGYIGFDGNVDLNIVIRTIVIKDNIAYFGVGGGITWDSVEKEEYNETLDKARALMRVLKGD